MKNSRIITIKGLAFNSSREKPQREWMEYLIIDRTGLFDLHLGENQRGLTHIVCMADLSISALHWGEQCGELQDSTASNPCIDFWVDFPRHGICTRIASYSNNPKYRYVHCRCTDNVFEILELDGLSTIG